MVDLQINSLNSESNLGRKKMFVGRMLDAPGLINTRLKTNSNMNFNGSFLKSLIV
jgi:hypothetical protein